MPNERYKMKGSEKKMLKRERREGRSGSNANRKEKKEQKKNVNSLKREGKSGSWRRRKEKRPIGKPESMQVKILIRMRRMAMKRIKLKRQRMVMIKELIEVPVEVEEDLINIKRWSIRKKRMPHNQMERLLSSKVEKTL